MDHSDTSAPPLTAKQERCFRGWGSEWLDLWHVCANTACRRARACRGNAEACFAANFSQVPEGVQDWFILLIQARVDGLSFDEAWAELTEFGLIDELGNWHNLTRGPNGAGAAN
jgi:hypothetical protein